MYVSPLATDVQVRNIVGALVEVGLGRLTVDDVRLLIQHRQRELCPPPAPPEGLFLTHVHYPPHYLRCDELPASALRIPRVATVDSAHEATVDVDDAEE